MCSILCKPIWVTVYINDFNRFWPNLSRVCPGRGAVPQANPKISANLKTRNLNGDMVPMGALADIRFEAGPDRVSHYNVYLALGHQWTGIARQPSSSQPPRPWNGSCRRRCRMDSGMSGRI